MWVYIWLGVVVASLILEFVTMELVSVWISIGAFVSMILALCGVDSVVLQIAVAVVISITCILCLRKVTLKFLNRNQDKTNLDLAVGTKIKLLEDVTEEKHGSAMYNGVVWSIKNEDETKKLKAGTFVEIVKVEGNKLIVKKAENQKAEKPKKEEEKTPAQKTEKEEDKKEEVKTKKTSKRK